jgi:hypothetical protein
MISMNSYTYSKYESIIDFLQLYNWCINIVNI